MLTFRYLCLPSGIFWCQKQGKGGGGADLVSWERYATNRISWIVPESTYITEEMSPVIVMQESSDKEKSHTLYITEEMGSAIVIQESSEKEKSPTLYIAEEMGPAIVVQESSKKENSPASYRIAEELGPATLMQESIKKPPYLNNTNPKEIGPDTIV